MVALTLALLLLLVLAVVRWGVVGSRVGSCEPFPSLEKRFGGIPAMEREGT